MIPPHVRRFLRMQRIAMTMAGLCFGLLLSVFANWLSEKLVWLIPLVITAALISGVIGVVLYLRKPVSVEVLIRTPRTIRSPADAQRYARRGFVGFVPLYTPKRGMAADALSPEERLKAAEALEFDRLDVEASNLQPTIEAIVSHADRLEHCWLLATKGSNVPGSLPYARLLAEYLRQRKKMQCDFHYGEPLSISLDDDALVLSKTYDQVRQILKEAELKGLSAQEVVADMTTGVRSMTLGMVLACLDGDHDVEFVGTRYDERGQPTGKLFPVIFSFEPVLE